MEIIRRAIRARVIITWVFLLLLPFGLNLHVFLSSYNDVLYSITLRKKTRRLGERTRQNKKSRMISLASWLNWHAFLHSGQSKLEENGHSSQYSSPVSEKCRQLLQNWFSVATDNLILFSRWFHFFSPDDLIFISDDSIFFDDFFSRWFSFFFLGLAVFCVGWQLTHISTRHKK